MSFGIRKLEAHALEHRLIDLFVVDVIGPAGYASILSSTLPDQLQYIIDTWQNVVLEDNRIKDLRA